MSAERIARRARAEMVVGETVSFFLKTKVKVLPPRPQPLRLRRLLGGWGEKKRKAVGSAGLVQAKKTKRAMARVAVSVGGDSVSVFWTTKGPECGVEFGQVRGKKARAGHVTKGTAESRNEEPRRELWTSLRKVALLIWGGSLLVRGVFRIRESWRWVEFRPKGWVSRQRSIVAARWMGWA
jgi:hypothetical protein